LGHLLGLKDGHLRLLQLPMGLAARLRMHLGKGHVAQDAGQKVIEIVSDPPSQRSSGLQLLDALPYGLRLPTFGDVPTHDANGPLTAIAEGAGHDLDVHDVPVWKGECGLKCEAAAAHDLSQYVVLEGVIELGYGLDVEGGDLIGVDAEVGAEGLVGL